MTLKQLRVLAQEFAEQEPIAETQTESPTELEQLSYDNERRKSQILDRVEHKLDAREESDRVIEEYVHQKCEELRESFDRAIEQNFNF
jgi:hypothetical protein